jgi:hypothetical protein
METIGSGLDRDNRVKVRDEHIRGKVTQLEVERYYIIKSSRV